MKKFYSVVLAIALVFGLMSPVTAKADWTTIGGNGSTDTSTQQSVSTIISDIYNSSIITGSFSAKGVKDYSFKPNKTGAIKVTLTASNESGYSYTIRLKKYVNSVWSDVEGYKEDNYKIYYNIEAGYSYILSIEFSSSKTSDYSIVIEDLKDITDNPAAASEIVMGTQIAGTLDTKADVDYYRFNTGKYNMLYITSYAGNECAPTYTIYKDTSGSDVAIVKEFNADSGHEDKSDVIRLEKNRVYYVKVNLWNYRHGEYSFILNGLIDVSDTTSGAKSIKFNKTVHGTCEINRDLDYYKFKATKSGRIKLTGNNPNFFYIYVKRKGSSTYVLKEWETGNYSFVFNVKKGKTYYIGIGDYPNKGDYSFKIKYK